MCFLNCLHLYNLSDPFFFTEDNIALNKTAYQSSTSLGHNASQAIDGIVFPEVTSYSQTLLEVNPWWLVDLEESTMISYVSITAEAANGK